MKNLQSEVQRERVQRAYAQAGIDVALVVENLGKSLWNAEGVKVHDATREYFTKRAQEEAAEFLSNPVILNLLHEVFRAGIDAGATHGHEYTGQPGSNPFPWTS